MVPSKYSSHSIAFVSELRLPRRLRFLAVSIYAGRVADLTVVAMVIYWVSRKQT
jgi:hypothetical protein